MTTYKIATFGAGFVGIPTSSVLAFHNPHHKVSLFIFSLLFTISHRLESSNASRTNLPFLNQDLNNCWWRSMESILHLLMIWVKPSLAHLSSFWLFPLQPKTLDRRKEKLMTCPTLKMLSELLWNTTTNIQCWIKLSWFKNQLSLLVLLRWLLESSKQSQSNKTLTNTWSPAILNFWLKELPSMIWWSLTEWLLDLNPVNALII